MTIRLRLPHRHLYATSLMTCALFMASCTNTASDGKDDEADTTVADTGAEDVKVADKDVQATVTDSGAATKDAGSAAKDAGSTPKDTGSASTDAGSSAKDTGPEDTGPVDSGVKLCKTASDCPEAPNSCEQAVCNSDGSCSYETRKDGEKCVGTSLCIIGGTCSKGVCKGAIKDCDDGNICTKDDCVLATGKCGHVPDPKLDNVVCTDADKCALAAQCFKGACITKHKKKCDDGNPCSFDACDPKTGDCVVLAGAATENCDDGNPCTEDDKCDKSGNCLAGKPICSCKKHKDCQDKDDGNLCNGSIYCDLKTSNCVLNEAKIVTCTGTKLPCMLRACDPKDGYCKNKPMKATTPCDDGNPCTAGDICDGAGKCKAGTVVCACNKTADCFAQNDGDPCNGTLFCDKSEKPYACRVNPKTVVKCPTFNDTACTKLKCSKKTGQCQMTEEPNGETCDDGNECTVADQCLAGKCKSGTDTCSCKVNADCAKLEDGNACNGTLFCNKSNGQCDLNPATVVTCPSAKDTYCRKNQCVPQTGKCVFINAHEGEKCDDLDDNCTKDETCQKGQCTTKTNLCACSSNADCAKMEDGDKCNGTMFCNKQSKKCEVNPATVVTCPTVDDTKCGANLCQPKTGKCAMVPRNPFQPCDADGDDKCTKNDYCFGGKCIADKNTCQCQTDKDCAKHSADDKCAEYYCNGQKNQCQPNPATVPFCSPLDDTTCAVNKCDPKTGKCAMTAINENLQCDADGSNCTVGDKCAKGKCAAGVNKCQCTKNADCAKLEDGNPCTGKLVCGQGGQCVVDAKTVIKCQTGGDNACLENRCDPKDGKCKATAVNEKSPCGKGTLCTGVPLCNAGKCAKGVTVTCDDNDPCTIDSCDDYKGCVTKPKTGDKCDDGNKCTESDVCVKGKCTGKIAKCAKASDCIAASCSPLKGCIYLAVSGACDDGNACTVNDTCVAGKCAADKVTCDDKNTCTDDSCDPQKGCQFIFGKAKCDDGNKCTDTDACNQGTCIGKPIDIQKVCEDGNTCTIESCNKDIGCVHTAKPKINRGPKYTKLDPPCDDGKWCTAGDRCKGTVCKGTAPQCDPQKTAQYKYNKCVIPVCDEKKKTCTYIPVKTGGACDDNNKCTTNDVCTGTKSCVGKGVNCNDGNACTNDHCHKINGCEFSFNGHTCNDGSLCTTGTKCASGVCQGGVQRTCDDGESCTNDSCDAKKGCVFKAGTDDKVCGDASDCQTEGKCKAGRCEGATARPWFRDGLSTEGNCGDIVPGDNGDHFLFGSRKNTALVQEPAWMVLNYAGKVSRAWSIPSSKPGFLQKGIRFKGGFVAVGHTYDGAKGGTDGLFVRIAGESTVTTKHVLGGSKAERFHSVAGMSDGGHVLAGVTQSKGAGLDDGWLVRLDKADKIVWDKPFGTIVSDAFLDVAALDDDHITAVGSVGLYGGWIARVHKDGTLVKQVLDGNSSDRRRYAFVEAIKGGGSLVGGKSLKTYDKDLKVLKQTKAHGGFVDDIAVRPGGGYAITWSTKHSKNDSWSYKATMVDAAGADYKWTIATFPKGVLSNVEVTSINAGGDSGRLDGAVPRARIVAVGADSFIAMRQKGCRLLHPDNFGNVKCSDSGTCFTKKRSDCADDTKCTRLESCHKGQCTKMNAPGVPCKDGGLCIENKGCDPKDGKCKYGPAPDGYACSSAGGPCALKGKCASGKCTGEGMAAWTAAPTVFYGCCGEMGRPGKRRDSQNADFRYVGVNPNSTVWGVGIGFSNAGWNSIYGKSFSPTGVAGARYALVQVAPSCVDKNGQKIKTQVLKGKQQYTGCSTEKAHQYGPTWYQSAGAVGLSDSSVVLLARVPDLRTVCGWHQRYSWGYTDCRAVTGTRDPNTGRYLNYKLQSYGVGSIIKTDQHRGVVLNRWGSGVGWGARQTWLGSPRTVPAALARSDDRQFVAALCTDHEADDPKKPLTYSVYGVNYSNLKAAGSVVLKVQHRFGDKDAPTGIDVTAGNGVLICGQTYVNASKQTQNVAAMLSSKGTVVWKKADEQSESSVIRGCALTEAGSILAGTKRTTIAGTSVNSLWLQARNAVGNVAWQAKYKPSSHTNVGINVIPVKGGFVVGGKLSNQSALVRFDNNGNLVADKRFGGDVRDWKRMPDGGFVGAGWSGKPYVVRTDAFGNAPCDKVGKCLGKTPADCDDKNNCTIDSCDATNGCTNKALDDGVTCGSDDNPCTEDALCSSGKCGTAALIKDGTGCEDGNPCTEKGACKTGKCAPGAKKAEWTVCDDGSQCVTGGRCDASGACHGKAVCNDGKPCTLDKCSFGACTYVPIAAGGACDDGDICTESSTCDKDGKCSGKDECTWKTVYNEPFNCGSTSFSLYGAKNGVGWAVDGTPSVPGFKSKDCSLNTNNGTTYGTEKLKLDARQKASWRLPPRGKIVARFWSYYGTKDAQEASDDRRTLNPFIGKWLIFLTDSLDLNKWYEREIDLSDKPNAWLKMRFVHQTDGDSNTGAGWFVDDYRILQGTPKKGFPCRFSSQCNDGQRCTKDECVAQVCKWTTIPEGGACDDGDICTEKDVCDKAGVCKGPVAKTCDDGDPCTVDKCAANRGGCYTEPGNDGTTCDDKSPCTTSDKCAGGACRGVDKCNDGNPCTWESCNANGTCKKTNVTKWTPCGGGRQCNGSGTCFAPNGGWGAEARGFYHSVCARRTNGELWCWGLNKYGAFANGTQTQSLIPVKANLPGTVLDFDLSGSSGTHACAVIDVSGTRDVYCWGATTQYLGGDPLKKTNILLAPNKIAGTTGALQVAAGARHACTLFDDGAVGCHGYGYGGQLTGTRVVDTPKPFFVPGITNAIQLAATGYATCALLADRTVSCWGSASNGELGRGFRSHHPQKPGLVTGVKDVVRVAAGQRHFCVQNTKREVWCWGDNSNGQIGDGTKTRRETAVKVAWNLDERAVLGLGMQNTCVMATNDVIKCWGRGNEGQIGNRSNNSTTKIGQPVYGINSMRTMGRFYYTPCAVRSTGTVYCWGEGSFGQIGNNAKTDQNRAVRVNGT